MDERTQGAMLLAVGGVALRLGLTDASLAYVKPSLRPLLAVAGAVLVVLGTAAVVHAFRGAGTTAAAPALEGVAHGHDHGGGPRVAWLLALPLLAVLLVAPPPLGAFAANRAAAPTVATTRTTYPPLPPEEAGAVPLSLTEYTFRTLYDEDASLEGRRVRLTGFAQPAADGDGYLLTRFLLSCCAADGRPVSVTVVGDDVPRAADQWLEVEGHWEAGEPAGAPGGEAVALPRIVAAEVIPVEQPAEPYEY